LQGPLRAAKLMEEGSIVPILRAGHPFSARTVNSFRLFLKPVVALSFLQVQWIVHMPALRKFRTGTPLSLPALSRPNIRAHL
jgi:hypothetical protein